MDLFPAELEPALVRALNENEQVIEDGAVLVLEPARARIRILPLQ